MSMPMINAHLQEYTRNFEAPVESRTTVHSVNVEGFGYRVSTELGDWTCDNLVLATEACA